MELSERAIRTFESEGFTEIYEHQDLPGVVYDERSNHTNKAIFVTDGSITYTMGGEEKLITAPNRFNIPANTAYSAKVGSDGMIAIIAE